MTSTADAPPVPDAAPVAGDRSPETGEAWTLRGFVREHPWWTTAVAILVLSTALVVWARTRPGFDPYGWLVWGHQTLTASIDTNAAPSWKPLPYLLTVPFALFGHYEMWLWMIASVAVSLSGVVFAGRIAYKLVGADEERPYAAWIAAVFAGLGVLAIHDYSHYILSAQSDPMIVALCLGAIDMHLSKRPRWAFVLWILASLGRPEVWPFLGLYSIWAWRAVPSMRRFLVVGIVALLALWFGIPALTARTPFVAGTNAIGSGRAPHGNKVTETISRFVHLQPAALEIVALLSIGLALLRRDLVTLAIAAGIVLWVVVEIAFALHGWPALPRYMYEAGAAVAVVAAVAVGRLLRDPPRLSPAAGWGGIALVVLICGVLVPTAISRAGAEHKDLNAQRKRTDEINRLSPSISRAGGAALIRSCGEPLTRLMYQTAVAFTLRMNVARIGWKYGPAIRSTRPIVLISPTSHGWRIKALHQRSSACRRLPK